MSTYRKLLTWGLFSLLGLLCACSSTDDELERYIKRIKVRPAKARLEPIPEFKALPKFTYRENDNRRSPFRPIQVKKPSDVFAPNMNRPKQPLEAYPLDALKFVGILKQGRSIWGLIAQPDGKISYIKVGDYMGTNYGKVIDIQSKTITLLETIMVSGQWERKQITLDIRTPK